MQQDLLLDLLTIFLLQQDFQIVMLLLFHYLCLQEVLPAPQLQHKL